MIHVVLHNPKIPPNTGNVIRLAANVGFQLHLIEPLGFDFEEKQLRRAGLDYHDLSTVTRHENYSAFIEAVKPKRLFAITTKGHTRYSDVKFEHDDGLLFGSETEGLPADVMQSIAEYNRLLIPMQPNNRSLNLSNSVSILVYEAWRQLGFEGAID
jgi:tRNA (cytidine/uridine-2'-O-)-methyltransferase